MDIKELAHLIVGQFLHPGDIAVDATAGCGRDSLFLASRVVPGGRVCGFDIQEEAIEKTDLLLREHGLRKTVKLVHDGHENLAPCSTGACSTSRHAQPRLSPRRLGEDRNSSGDHPAVP